MAKRRLPHDSDDAARQIRRLSDAFRNSYREFEPIGGASRAVLGMGLGWGIRACRTAEAIVELHRSRLDPETSPLVRSLMEHAMKLRWLAAEGDGAIEAVEYGHRRYQRLLKLSIDEGSWVLDDVDKDLPPSDLDMDRPDQYAAFDNFQEMIRRYGGDSSWYAAYRLESASSHASYASGARYWNEDRIDEPGFGLEWEPGKRGTPLRVSAVWLLLGLGQFEDMSVLPERFGRAVRDVDARLAAVADQL